MANRKILLCLLIVSLFVFIVECKERKKIKTKHGSCEETRKLHPDHGKRTTSKSTTKPASLTTKKSYSTKRRPKKRPTVTIQQQPKYVYINQYRNSGSRYGDLLAGLAIYNIERTHSQHREYYYLDDFYIKRYNNKRPNSRVTEEAVCTLTITENGTENFLKIPCEIVSTFTREADQMKLSNILINSTACSTNSTVIKTNIPANISTSSSVNQSLIKSPVIHRLLTTANVLGPVNNISIMPTVNSTGRPSVQQSTNTVAALKLNSTQNSTKELRTVGNVKVENGTLCNTTTNIIDPLNVKGPRINPSNIECAVEFHTKKSRMRNKINCNTLLEHAKIPLPKEGNDGLLPSRKKLQSWLYNPPWWTSIFINV